MPQMSPILWVLMFISTLLVTHMLMNLAPTTSMNPLKTNRMTLGLNKSTSSWLW